MAALDDLLARITDPALREALTQEIKPLRGEQELGLVFERHLPEKARLYGHPVRRGLAVELRAQQPSPTWTVMKVVKGTAHLRRQDDEGAVLSEEALVDDLVVVREFGQPIYPGLQSVGRVARGGRKPFHAVINAENHHALETLLYAHRGNVDCIYIDPPYNTGARDWKYNNDYVDGNDGFRHSKWLSFMEKRLKIAKRLLKPDDSVLIVTIDEKEYLRLGMLLEQIFPTANRRMISSVINPKGVGVTEGFKRVDEYVFVMRLGEQRVFPSARPLLGSRPMEDVGSQQEARETDGEAPASRRLDWQTARRRDLTSARRTRPAQFYPIYVNTQSGQIEEIGEAIPHDMNREDAPQRKGCVAVFPVRDDGTEMNWGVTAPTFRSRWEKGYARAGKPTPGKAQPYIIQYLKSGPIEDIEAGRAIIEGRNPDGSVIAFYSDPETKFPPTQWNLRSHNAEHYGTKILRSLLPARVFPYPKSLYAVEDTLRLFLFEKPDALVLDFFGGSGTTAHAVMRLNRQDGGHRRAIVVTNNEVGIDEQRELLAEGCRPGDPRWESRGIFEYITKPRIEAAVTGKTPDSKPVEGEYKFTDPFPMAEGFDENVEFFRLTYEDRDRVELGLSFEAIAPLLWLRAGAQDSRVDRIDPKGWSLPQGGRYGVLFNPDKWRQFIEALADRDDVTHAFIVTDSDSVFQQVVAELPAGVEPGRLYASYLASFAINTGAHP